jgi:hypothetical protein
MVAVVGGSVEFFVDFLCHNEFPEEVFFEFLRESLR